MSFEKGNPVEISIEGKWSKASYIKQDDQYGLHEVRLSNGEVIHVPAEHIREVATD